MGRERRRRSRRTPRTGGGIPASTRVQGAPDEAPEGAPAAAAPRERVRSERPATVQVRSDRVIARESEYMMTEIKRVVYVSAVCFGMLAVLVGVDRLT